MIVIVLAALLIVGGLVAWILDRSAARVVALLTLGLALVLAAGMFALLPPNSPWLVLDAPWIPGLGVRAQLAVDGLSAILIALALVVGALAALVSWSAIQYRPGFFYFNLLVTLAGVVGVFGARDLILFYVFWELMLVPMVLLIALWGHEDRIRAALKFFVFTQAGSLLMLAAIVALGANHAAATGAWSFQLADLLQTAPTGYPGLIIMLGLFLGFAVKLPALPLHTWLPDAHTQAPTAGSVVLAGLLLKTGAYGLIRFVLPLFPEASLAIAPVAIILGVAGVLYGAVLAFSQTDLKRLVAYTSVSHMGFALIGIYAMTELALTGVVLLLVAHAFSTGGLFVLAGALDARLHTRDLGRMGGLWQSAPRMGAVALVLAVASLGLPGLANFAAEFSILFGAFGPYPVAVVVAALGLILAALYALRMLQAAFFGPPRWTDMTDVTPREAVVFGVSIVALIVLGLYPIPVMEGAQSAVRAALEPVLSHGGMP
jgi:NADH-quinone oxidoreductase subunit M